MRIARRDGAVDSFKIDILFLIYSIGDLVMNRFIQ